MNRRLYALLLILSLLCLPGCLLEDTRHTLFLAPDGSVTWRAVRDVIRSDHDDLDDRADEEASFLESFDAGEEGWSELLGELGAQETSVELLRAERPYTVLVRARFAHVQDLLAGLMADAKEDVLVLYEEDGSLRTLHIELPPGEEELGPEEAKGDEQSRAGDDFRLVLIEGRFIEADGFELSPDGVIAVPRERDEAEPQLYRLVWDVDA